MPDEKPLNPEAARAIAKVRMLMLLAMVTTFVAIGAVLFVIGYRVFHGQGSAPAAFADVTAALPAGAKVISTSVSSDHIVVTIEVGGTTELLTFDPDTLKPLGRLQPGTEALTRHPEVRAKRASKDDRPGLSPFEARRGRAEHLRVTVWLTKP